jgi:hypothetical protein
MALDLKAQCYKLNSFVDSKNFSVIVIIFGFKSSANTLSNFRLMVSNLY